MADRKNNKPSKGLIVIIEDNKLNMKLFNDLLEYSGYETRTLTTGLGAVDFIKNNKPDLVILDIQLPEVSGLEISRQVKSMDELKHIPIIAVTAFAMKGDEEKIRESGCDDYISKPINVKAFMQKIETYLSAKNK